MSNIGFRPSQGDTTAGVESGRVASAATVVALGTFASRIVGFLRDAVIAAFFGASPAADAFYVAYRIPNLFRELFAEGSMSAGFIPVFTQTLTREGAARAREVARSAFTLLAVILSALFVGVLFFAPLVVLLVAPGFSDEPGKFNLTAMLTRFMFPYLIFISLSALAMGILNAMRRFFAPAFSPVVANLVIIGSVLGVSPFLAEPIYAVAIGVTAGGVVQFLFQLPVLYRSGMSLAPKRPFPIDPAVRRMGLLLIPTLVGLSVTQVNLLINTLIASYLPEGSVTYLYYGLRLIHLPLGIFAVALATALLPTLSVQAATGRREDLRKTLSFALRLIFFLTFPAMIGLILLRMPIIQVLFEHGQFSREATVQTASALLFYSLGLWAFAGTRVVVPAFYAMQDTRTPVGVGLAAVGANLVLNIMLMRTPLKHGGLALATSISAIGNLAGLIFFLNRKIGALEGGILRSHLQVAVASAGIILPSLAATLLPIWDQAGRLGLKSAILGGTILLSIGGYLFIHRLMKSAELSFLIERIWRKG